VSAARPALPFAFITSDKHYIPAYTLQAATTPASVEITKYYYELDAKELTKELEHALSLGPAAAEEWSKGLEARGKDRMRVAEIWERWEVKYQWWKSHHKEPSAGIQVTPEPATSQPQPRRASIQRTASPVIHAPVPTRKFSFMNPSSFFPNLAKV
jgi:hypothetical protein